MRKLLLLSTGLLMCISTYAQHKSHNSSDDAVFGLTGTFNLSSETVQTTSSSGNGTTSTTSGFQPGFSAGLFAEAPLGGNIFLSPELLYSMKGAKFTGANQIYSYAYNEYLGYLNLPLLLKFKVPNAAGFNVFLGPEFGYLVSAKDKSTGSIGSYTATTESNVYTHFKPFDLGLDFGAGFDFSKNIGIDARYSLGLVNVSKNYGQGTNNSNTTLKNRSFQFGLRFMF